MQRIRRFLVDHRELSLLAGFSLAVLLPLLIFVAAGWPGAQDPCVTDVSEDATNSCYCEPFEPAEIGERGVRQPFNTWSNLYALLTGLFVAWRVYQHRQNRLRGTNRMRSTDLYPLIYVLVVVFLGLGSMWFHASLVKWGGVIDNLSMYAFANFLLCYTLVRVFDRDWLFYYGYPSLTIAFTVLNAFGVEGFVLIAYVVVPLYALFELYIAIFMPHVRSWWKVTLAYYVPALLFFGTALLVWALSQTGGPLCLDTHWFQFHGLWHALAGVTAVLLYFYWRDARR